MRGCGVPASKPQGGNVLRQSWFGAWIEEKMYYVRMVNVGGLIVPLERTKYCSRVAYARRQRGQPSALGACEIYFTRQHFPKCVFPETGRSLFAHSEAGVGVRENQQRCKAKEGETGHSTQNGSRLPGLGTPSPPLEHQTAVGDTAAHASPRADVM